MVSTNLPRLQPRLYGLLCAKIRAMSDVPIEVDDEKILLVNDALDKFTAHDPQKAEIVKLRYFVGLNHREIAGLMGIAEKTVIRHWAYAKAWLCDVIEQQLAKED